MICITGAGGNVGREIVKQLEGTSVDFRAAYFSQGKALKAMERGINTALIDYQQPETLMAAFRNCQKIFLVGPNAENQTELEMNVLQAAMAAGVKHVVKLSVFNAEEESYSLAKFHRPVEKALEASDMKWTFLRSNQFMQNFSTYAAPAIKEHDTIYSASGDAKISQVDVRDVAEVAIKALTEEGHSNKAYTLTGPSAFSYDEAAEAFSSALGRTIKHVGLSLAEFKQGMIINGASEKMAEALTDLDRYFREGKPSTVTSDIKAILGREARSLTDFIQDMKAIGIWD